MLDYIQSKLAQQEHEQRVRLLTPVRDHEDWLKDDRQLSIWPIRAGLAGTWPDRAGAVSRYAQRLVSVIGNALASLGERFEAQAEDRI